MRVETEVPHYGVCRVLEWFGKRLFGWSQPQCATRAPRRKGQNVHVGGRPGHESEQVHRRAPDDDDVILVAPGLEQLAHQPERPFDVPRATQGCMHVTLNGRKSEQSVL